MSMYSFLFGGLALLVPALKFTLVHLAAKTDTHQLAVLSSAAVDIALAAVAAEAFLGEGGSGRLKDLLVNEHATS